MQTVVNVFWYTRWPSGEMLSARSFSDMYRSVILDLTSSNLLLSSSLLNRIFESEYLPSLLRCNPTTNIVLPYSKVRTLRTSSLFYILVSTEDGHSLRATPSLTNSGTILETPVLRSCTIILPSAVPTARFSLSAIIKHVNSVFTGSSEIIPMSRRQMTIFPWL